MLLHSLQLNRGRAHHTDLLKIEYRKLVHICERP
ncbi:Uncharacterised protein [Vibrio cholerae]|nr:Uncharacterised protein [Vibrio cholerae]